MFFSHQAVFKQTIVCYLQIITIKSKIQVFCFDGPVSVTWNVTFM